MTGDVKRVTSELKLIANSFHGSDTVDPQLLPDLPDMDINGAVTHNYIIAPDLVQDFVPKENPSGF